MQAPGPGWLGEWFTTDHIAGGYLEEDGVIWDHTGDVVAVSQQMAILSRYPAMQLAGLRELTCGLATTFQRTRPRHRYPGPLRIGTRGGSYLPPAGGPSESSCRPSDYAGVRISNLLALTSRT